MPDGTRKEYFTLIIKLLGYTYTASQIASQLVKLGTMLGIWHASLAGGEALLLVRGLNATSSFDDCGNEKRFVNIDTTTGLVSNFHSQTPFVKEEKPLTELPHN